MAHREITCQGVSARMMELLYGELSGDERATIEAHLGACPSCRAELAALRSTRASARRALDADEPPARAHQAILRAAAAAAAAKQPNLTDTRAAASRPSFWERWRGRWTLPTFATVGAVAVVVLASKVFLEPGKTVELGRQALRSAPAEAPAPPTAGGGAQLPEREKAKSETHPKREVVDPDLREPAPANQPPARSIATPTTAKRRRGISDGFGAVGGLVKGGGVASAEKAKAAPSNSDALSFGADKASAPAVASQPAKREFAPPPPPRAQPASPAPAAANQMRGRDSEGESAEDSAAAPRGSSAPASASAGAAPRSVHPGAMKKLSAPAETDDLDRLAAADEERKADARSPTRPEAKPFAESPVAHADRLFAQGQWAAAARAYRDLLRRDPSNGDAARWRQRLAAAEEAASAQAPAAPAASPARR